MIRTLLMLALLLVPVVSFADDYFEPEALKGTITFEGGVMTARFDTEWGTYTYLADGVQLAQGDLGVVVYHQDTQTYEWLLCRNFWSIYAKFYDGIQPQCPQIFNEAHQSKSSDETRMIWTYKGVGVLPREPFSMFAYVLWYTDGVDQYEQYAGELTCKADGAKTVCTTLLAPDPEPGSTPPKPDPNPKPSSNLPDWYYGGIGNDSFYGCGTFGC